MRKLALWSQLASEGANEGIAVGFCLPHVKVGSSDGTKASTVWMGSSKIPHLIITKSLRVIQYISFR
jgi:hypothetical protein